MYVELNKYQTLKSTKQNKKNDIYQPLIKLKLLLLTFGSVTESPNTRGKSFNCSFKISFPLALRGIRK